VTTPNGPVVELSDVSKDYRGLRPLRIVSLAVLPGEHVAILGLDQTTAEVFVNLITGASLPDRGDVRLFGRSTAAIADSADWLAVVDRFGIVSRRAVLLDSLTVVQNLAMPFTLEIEPPSAEIRQRALELARCVGLPAAAVDHPVAELGPAGHVRVRLGRALALDPAVVIL
jgi:ABC-type transporter Mla maintaining outer membrane lipid asymmetry ATPase subunit MlaF